MKQQNIKFLLALLLSMLGVKASAHDIEVKNDDGVTIYYTYINNNTELAVSYRGSSYGSYSYEYSGDVVIPESVTYNGKTYPVTSIGSDAFHACNSLTSITIPNSVTSIGYGAFYGTAWYDNQPDGLVYAGKVAYTYKGTMPSNTKIVLEEGTLGIANSAFDGCSGLTSVTIPNSVTSIGEGAFRYCIGLTEVNYNATNCTTMGSSNNPVFSGCSSLSTVNIGDNVQNIPSYAFYGCSGLTSITIPNSVTSIGEGAFRNCSGLTSITIPNSVTSIGAYAFCGCSGLTSITIGNSVTSIGSYAFSGCSGLTSITIPNSVTSIGEYALASGSSLESVTIGTGVLSIGNNVFNYYRPAKVIWLTNTPPNGYRYAEGMVNYVANDQYTSLSNRTVYKFLSSTFEVDGVKYVPVSPSERTCDAIDCTYDPAAENITIGETAEYKGVQMTVNQIMPYALYNNQYVKNVMIGCSGNVPNYAFSSCSSLQTATLGENVTGIGEYAFSGCSKLEGMFIPNSVTTIGQCAFGGCSALSYMQIGNKVATINSAAFQNCTSLLKIMIPQSVTKIYGYVFSGCTSLKDVYFADRSTILTLGSNGSSPLFADCPLDSVYIGGNISYQTASNYGYSPFYRNSSLRTVVITDEETEISANEFYGCTNLQSFKVGDGVTTFGDWAFSGCSSLKSLSFGSQLQTIGKEAFSDCTSVTEITSLTATPPACGSQALDDINKWECTLHVPENSLAAYQAADQWKEFLFADENSGSGEIPHVEQPDLVIGEAGVATYCPTVDVDFTTLTAVKAYIGSGFNRETGVLTMTRVYDVPAGTGLLVKGTAGTYEVPESPSASVYVNLLRGVTVERKLSATTGGYANYVLASGSNGTGFYRVPAEGTTLAAGRAYLTIPAETAASRSALRLAFDDEDEATGICASLTNSEERIENSAVYDLQGRRVEQPQPGLYIRNGKKVIIK